MEFPYNYIVVAWLATWILIVPRLYLPSMECLKTLSPGHVVYRYRHINLILFACFTFLFVPLLTLPVFNNKYRFLFIKSYVGGMLK